MLAVLLRGDGWQVAYLGADTPLREAVSFAEQLGARIVCFSASTREHADRLTKALARERVPEQIEVLVGGRATSGLDVRAAVEALRRQSVSRPARAAWAVQRQHSCGLRPSPSTGGCSATTTRTWRCSAST